MNKEEKEAVAHLKWLLDDSILSSEDEPQINIVLNLIQKQEKEIEELKEDSCCMTNCVRRDKEKLFLEDKIKEKIDKLEDIRMENLGTQYYGIVEQCENKIEVLQELLKGE